MRLDDLVSLDHSSLKRGDVKSVNDFSDEHVKETIQLLKASINEAHERAIGVGFHAAQFGINLDISIVSITAQRAEKEGLNNAFPATIFGQGLKPICRGHSSNGMLLRWVFSLLILLGLGYIHTLGPFPMVSSL